MWCSSYLSGNWLLKWLFMIAWLVFAKQARQNFTRLTTWLTNSMSTHFLHYLQFNLYKAFRTALFDIEPNLNKMKTNTNHHHNSAIYFSLMRTMSICNPNQNPSLAIYFILVTSHWVIRVHPAAVYLVTPAQNGSLASQTQTDGTHDAGLASSVGSNNHIQIRSRIHHRVVIGPVRVQGKVSVS